MKRRELPKAFGEPYLKVSRLSKRQLLEEIYDQNRKLLQLLDPEWRATQGRVLAHAEGLL